MRCQLQLKSPSASQDVFCRRWWQAIKDIEWPMQALRYFFLQGSLSMRLNNRVLVGGLFPTLYHRSRCRELLQPCICRFCSCHCQISSGTLFCPLTPYLWYSTPVVIHRKHYKFSTSLKVWANKLAFSQYIAHGTAQRIWFQASDCVWFWWICYLTKLYQWEHSF